MDDAEESGMEEVIKSRKSFCLWCNLFLVVQIRDLLMSVQMSPSSSSSDRRRLLRRTANGSSSRSLEDEEEEEEEFDFGRNGSDGPSSCTCHQQQQDQQGQVAGSPRSGSSREAIGRRRRNSGGGGRSRRKKVRIQAGRPVLGGGCTKKKSVARNKKGKILSEWRKACSLDHELFLYHTYLAARLFCCGTRENSAGGGRGGGNMQ